MVKWWFWLFAASWASAQSSEEYQYKSPIPAGHAFLAEHFDAPQNFEERWIRSEARKEDVEEDIAKYDGQFEVEAPSDENHLKGDLGMVLKTKARHYAISAQLSRPFLFDHRPLVVQYEVQFQNGMECGGAYLKLLSQPKSGSVSDMQKSFNDMTRYSIMFGPDKCGTQQKLQLIFQHKNPKTGTFEEKHWKKILSAGGAMNGKFMDVFTDKKSHQYTLFFNPDNTFEILIDGRSEATGNLFDDFDPPVNPPKMIPDMSDEKPEDWDEREHIPDPEATKPDDWDEDEPKEIEDPNAEKPIGWLDDEPRLIPDPEAKQPTDWDEDMDGVWEAPLVDNEKCRDVGCGEWRPKMIPNPKYKGKWKAPMVDNPAYKGKWTHRMIQNPNYFEDLHPFRLEPVVAVGFELWSMSDGILFDNILVTDDKAVATQWSEDGFHTKRRMLDKSGPSWFTQFVEISTAYPWLWGIYVIGIGVPAAFLISYCCMSKSPSPEDEYARRKKSDLEGDEGTEQGLVDLMEADEEHEDGKERAADDVEGDVEGNVEGNVEEPGEDEEAVEEPDEDGEEDVAEEDKPREQGAGEAPKILRRRKARKD
ncbi:calnexin [Galendromus occidentalis]|uniref:Calnexin n=1 Tax=Galendromus occidentalis TaxID=34638 RepID=A0AAJ6QX96_9ACAR|nr:calnexin [Galendromus occidentalis]XP_028968302.1 calnexin [Galendromus occidentalis]